ncbi:MAG: hypothetical protein WB444_14755 [Gallionella sp.]
MKYAIVAASLFASFATATIQLAHADESGKFTLETGMDYNTGKYGGSQATNILYVPVTGKYQYQSWTLKLTVPYLRMTGPLNVINGIGVINSPNATNTTRSGLGDVIASASHPVYSNRASGLLVNLTGKIKFGTASSAQGLGTGMNDYIFESDIYQVTGDLTKFGTIGYKIYGSPAGYTLNNILYGSLGGSYRFDPQTNGGVIVRMGEKSTTTGSSRMEAIFFVTRKLDRAWQAQGYLLKGFTNSVPDFGAGATIAYQF